MHRIKGRFRFLNPCDVVALLAGIALLVYLLLTARLGVGIADEAFYYSVPQRLLNGDRLFIEEWHLTQLSSLFSVLPYWLFTLCTGGTEGVILFMRVFFVISDILFYAYLYFKLREFGFWGFISAFLFCAVLPEGNYAISYFTVSSMAIMAACILLFVDKNRKPYKSIAAGVLFAFGVVAEPLLFLLYIAYSAAVFRYLISNGRGKSPQFPFLQLREWFLFTGGGFVVLAALLIFFGVSGTLRSLSVTLPYLFTGDEFNRDNFIEFPRIIPVVRFFGPAGCICVGLCYAVMLFFTASKKWNDRSRLLLFLLSIAAFIICSVSGLISVFGGEYGKGVMNFVLYHDVPILLIVPILYFLCNKKDGRFLAVWICGVLYSAAVDISSNVVMGTGGRIVQIAGMLILAGLLPELRSTLRGASKKTKAPAAERRREKAFSFVLALGAVVFFVWNAAHIGAEGFFQPAERMYRVDDRGRHFVDELTVGPFKNLRTNDEIRDVYLATLRDLDLIVQNANGAKFIAVGINPYMYLYADLPYGCISAWDQNPMERSIAYWELLKEQKPGYAYFSYYPFMFSPAPQYLEPNKEAFIRYFGECEIIEGEAGCIVRVAT